MFSRTQLPILRTILIALLFLTSLPAWGQGIELPSLPTTIHGIVRDAVTHQGIAHAAVTLDREDSGFVGQATTDTGGKFTFQAPGQMVFVVRVRMTGYAEGSQRIDLTMAASDYVTLELKPTKTTSTADDLNTATLNARDAAVPANARKEYNAAKTLFADNKPGEDGIKHLRKAIQIYPQYADAYVLLAMAYIGENNTNDARSNLDKAIEIDPKLAEAHLTLGMLLNHQQDYAGAEKSLSRGLELNPQAPQGHYELAKTYWAMGKWQDAEPHAMKAVELKPDMAPAHVLLGNIALRKQEPQTALKEFQEYLKLDPNGPMAGGVQQMIAKIEQALKAPQ